MTHPAATDSHERTAPANDHAPGIPIEVDGMTIQIDGLWKVPTACDRVRVEQIAREMRQPWNLSPDLTDHYSAGYPPPPLRSDTMPYIDSHGRPELLVHPDIVGGPASWRTEPADVEKDAGLPAPRRRRAASTQPTGEQSIGGGTD